MLAIYYYCDILSHGDKMKFKYAIFDMDGTLLDTMDYWRNVVIYYAELKGLPKPNISAEDAVASAHLSTFKKVAFLKERYNDIAVQQIKNEDVFEIMDYCYQHYTKVKPGVVEMLETLKANGVKMCVASATPSYLIKKALSIAGIDQYFDLIVSPTEYPKCKQDPEIFLGIAKSFGCDVTDIVLFEDALYSIKTASELGVRIIAVYDKYAEKHTDEIKKLANEYYNELTEFKFG